MYVCMYIYMYLYIYTYRVEPELCQPATADGFAAEVYIFMYICVYIYIYMYINKHI